MIQKIKELRVSLDGITQLVESLDPQGIGHSTRTREISLTITSLQLSKMWLGKVLKELGNANPYPESKNPANEKIEPTADRTYINHSEALAEQGLNWKELTHIAKVKWLRAEIEKVESEYIQLFVGVERVTLRVQASENLSMSEKYCIEAGMWLGMELGRIRDQYPLTPDQAFKKE